MNGVDAVVDFSLMDVITLRVYFFDRVDTVNQVNDQYQDQQQADRHQGVEQGFHGD